MTAEPIDTIAAAIATRYTAANMPAPGGLPAVRVATASLPQALTQGLPAVLVFVDAGTVGEHTTGTRTAVHSFLVRFYLAVAKDLPRETNQLRTWLPVLVGQHQAGLTLGGLVTAVRTVRWQVGQLRYANRVYSGVELRVEAVTSIPWGVTA